MKKILFTLILGVISLMSAAQEVVEISNIVSLEDGTLWRLNMTRDGGKTLFEDGQYIFRDQEGYSTTHAAIKNGRFIDTVRDYVCERNVLLQELIYDQQGKLHGEQRKFYEENGEPKSLQNYNHGVQEGKSYAWYQNGKMRYSINCKNDKLNGEIEIWDECGCIVERSFAENDLLNGSYTQWKYHDDFTLIMTGSYHDNRDVAMRESYIEYPDGTRTLHSKILCDSTGVEQYSWLRINSERSTEKFYTDNRLTRQLYYNNGILESTDHYDDNEMIVRKSEYHPNGKIYQEKFYNDEKEAIRFEKYDSSRVLLVHQSFDKEIRLKKRDSLTICYCHEIA